MDVAALRLVLVDSGAGPWPAALLLTLGVSLAAELRDPRHRDALALTPLLHELAVDLRLNPVLLLLPATRASCVALVMPLPSYPNALLCDYAHIPTRELVKAGLLLKTTFLGSELLSLTILGRVLFDLNYVPDKATGSVNASTAPTLSPLTYGVTP
ncbi:Na(+)/citrate cotransporter-like [Haemaphysalis longicornis]